MVGNAIKEKEKETKQMHLVVPIKLDNDIQAACDKINETADEPFTKARFTRTLLREALEARAAKIA